MQEHLIIVYVLSGKKSGKIHIFFIFTCRGPFIGGGGGHCMFNMFNSGAPKCHANLITEEK